MSWAATAMTWGSSDTSNSLVNILLRKGSQKERYSNGEVCLYQKEQIPSHLGQIVGEIWGRRLTKTESNQFKMRWCLGWLQRGQGSDETMRCVDQVLFHWMSIGSTECVTGIPKNRHKLMFYCLRSEPLGWTRTKQEWKTMLPAGTIIKHDCGEWVPFQ